MSKKTNKTETVPDHIRGWATLENQIATAEEFAQRVRDDAVADVLTGRPIENARLIARGVAHDEASRQPRPATRKDELQSWIDNSVAKCPELSVKERYNNAEKWIQNEVGLGRFARRVAAARKKVLLKSD